MYPGVYWVYRVSVGTVCVARCGTRCRRTSVSTLCVWVSVPRCVPVVYHVSVGTVCVARCGTCRRHTSVSTLCVWVSVPRCVLGVPVVYRASIGTVCVARCGTRRRHTSVSRPSRVIRASCCRSPSPAIGSSADHRTARYSYELTSLTFHPHLHSLWVVVRYDTRTKRKKWKREKLKGKKADVLRNIGRQSGESVQESVLKKKRKAMAGRICRKGRF